MTLREWEIKHSSLFAKAGVDSPGLCAQMLLKEVCGLDSLQLAMAPERKLNFKELQCLEKLAKRRLTHEPMAYIIGKRDFYEHSFLVSKATLIPRPETELLVDLALNFVHKEKAVFLDAGCGCGNIGLSILAARSGWKGILLDISEAALDMAQKNASKIAPWAVILQGDLFQLPLCGESLDLLVANPPYIGLKDKEEVMPAVLAFEPFSALFSEEDGFGHLKGLAREAMRTLKAGGVIAVEHGACQREKLASIFRNAGFRDLVFYDDLAALPRCLTARKPAY